MKLTREDLYLRSLRAIWEGMALESPEIDETLATFLDPTTRAYDLKKAEKETLRDLLSALHTDYWCGIDPWNDEDQKPTNTTRKQTAWTAVIQKPK